MLDYAHASLAHWRAAGAEVRNQRGQWLLARVYAVLGEGARALKHAQLCYELIEKHKSGIEDFDFAFAYEAIARAYAANGDNADARRYIQMAQKAGRRSKKKRIGTSFSLNSTVVTGTEQNKDKICITQSINRSTT